MLELVAHVEAAAGGKQATILGTKKALRNLMPSMSGVDAALSDLYRFGYCGHFFGTPVVATPQRHKMGSTDFIYNDNVLTVIASGEKPIKCVYEGQSTIIMGNPMDNMDLTQEYLYGEKYGMGILMPSNAGIGRYEIA